MLGEWLERLHRFNPFRVGALFGIVTQGSPLRATLG